MDNDIYEVSHDEYIGFIDQIKPQDQKTDIYNENGYQIIKTYSTTTNTLYAMRMNPDSSGKNKHAHYYIFNMPLNTERKESPLVRKITLQTPEEVRNFFDEVSKIQKELKNHD